MNRALRKDFLMEIRKSFARFISIFFIVALGVAFFSGINASSPDMRISGDAYYDENHLMNLKVISSLGLSKENIQALEEVDGVQSVEPGYMIDVLCGEGNDQVSLRLESLPDQMNQLTISEGRLPEKKGEVVLDSNLKNNTTYQIGDTCQFYTEDDIEGKDQEEDTKLLQQSNYTVVGFVSSPMYISFDRGNTTLGNGELDGFAYVTADNFNQDYYVDAYIQVKGAKSLASYSNEYDNLIDKITKKVEGIEKKQCQVRYDQVVGEANDTLEDARAELADKTKEANDKLEDARITLEDARKKLEDGKQELADARQKLADGKQELADGQQELEEKQQELADAQNEVNDGWIQLENGQNELNDKINEYNSGLAEAQSKIAQGESGLAQYDAGIAQAQSGYQQLQQQYNQAQAAGADAGTLQQIAGQMTQIQTQIAQSQAQRDALAQEVEAGKSQLEEASSQLDAAQAEIDENRQNLVNSQNQINDGQQQMEDAKTKLEEGRQEITENEQKLADAEAKLPENEQKLADGEKEYQDARTEADEKIADAQKKIDDAQADVNDIKMPEWTIQNRDDLPEYTGYGDNADRLTNIGKVFPAIFFLVAALISLTTMTRMVEEQRTQIGTMKALGYGKGAIAGKYLLYALLATLGGSVLGALIGQKIIPYVVITAYGIMYHHMKSLVIPYQSLYILLASGVAILCTLGATISACYKELAETPASLMRPPTPKEGKRVLLERITILWNHLNFTWKSTIRNLFRYKRRFFMTVFGIGGCMALILVGFGLRDSIMGIASLQYEKLQHYQATIISDTDAKDTDRAKLDEFLSSDSRIERFGYVYFKNCTAKSGRNSQDVYLDIPKDPDTFSEYVTLDNRVSGEIYTLDDSGAVLNEKTAKLLDVKVGDTIALTAENKTKDVKVAQICENYMGHYLYMTPSYYEKTFGEKLAFDDILLVVKEEYIGKEEFIGEDILTYPAALSISYSKSIEEQLDRMLSSLDTVMIVLIVSAGMLAFVVLYNLNNINVTERKRELATIKVLGFFDQEVAAYVYRENILLTIFGILAGILMGIALHRFVITTVEVDACMFGRNINWYSFVISGLFTAGFSVFVNFVMYFKLKKIDMVESLKSVE